MFLFEAQIQIVKRPIIYLITILSVHTRLIDFHKTLSALSAKLIIKITK